MFLEVFSQLPDVGASCDTCWGCLVTAAWHAGQPPERPVRIQSTLSNFRGVPMELCIAFRWHAEHGIAYLGNTCPGFIDSCPDCRYLMMSQIGFNSI